MPRFLRNFRKAVFLALEHDVLNTAKAAAYSGMLMFFPAFIVLTALVAKVPEGPTVLGEIRWVSGQILPADTVRLMLSSMQARNPHPGRLIVSGLALSVFAGLGLMLTLMEGFRRAYRLPRNEWGFLGAAAPRAFSCLYRSGSSRAGHAAAGISAARSNSGWSSRRDTNCATSCFSSGGWRAGRLRSSPASAVLGALYHFGTRRREHWLLVMPGAVAASAVWFPATLAFGWYVTRDRRLHHLLWVIWRGHCHAGVAVHHVVQRPAGRRTQRRSLPRAQSTSIDTAPSAESIPVSDGSH